MNPLDRQALVFPFVACLVCCLIGLSPRATRGEPRQAAPSATQPDHVMPSWRIDFQKPDPTSPHPLWPPGFSLIGADDSIRAESREPDKNGVLTLPDIPIAAVLPEEVLKLFAPGLSCVLENTASVLAREPGSPEDQPVDEILLRDKPPDGSEVGWIEVNVPDKITQGNNASIGLSIHHWDQIVRRVGSGVFRGHLDLSIHHPRFHGNEPIRLRQPVIVVIAGSRVISARTANAASYGARPEVRVEIESVEPTAGDELDPGWWLQMIGPGDPAPLVRLPLPIRESPTPDGPLFAIPRKGDLLCWDTIEVPQKLGYELGGPWKDSRETLIFQRRERGPNMTGLRLVEVHRHVVTTYLPPYSLVGKHEGLVFWDPRKAGNDVPPAPADPGKGTATRKTTGSIAVASGLGLSPELPLTKEPVAVSVAIDTRIDLTGKEGTPRLPELLHASVWILDPATREPGFVKWIELDSPVVDPKEPTVVRYRGSASLDKPGQYKIRLFPGGDPPPGAEARPAPPPDWPGLRDLERLVRVAVEGEDPDVAPSLDDDTPIKVFTDGQPFWWLSGEPGFTSPYKTERRPTEFQTNTVQAMSFRHVPGQDVQSLKLRFQGLYFDPTSNDHATDAIRRHENRRDAPSLRLFDWPGASGDGHKPFETNVDPGKDFDLKEKIGEARQFFDFDVEINSLSPEQRQGERGRGKQLRFARFALVGVDGSGKPIGRVYTKKFKVAVRSVWDEFWDIVPIELMALLGLAVVIGLAVLHNRIRKKKRKAQALASRIPPDGDDPSSHAVAESRDYFTGLDAVTEEPVSLPDKTAQAAPKPPPEADTSYFDKPQPGDEPGGARYFD